MSTVAPRLVGLASSPVFMSTVVSVPRTNQVLEHRHHHCVAVAGEPPSMAGLVDQATRCAQAEMVLAFQASASGLEESVDVDPSAHPITRCGLDEGDAGQTPRATAGRAPSLRADRSSAAWKRWDVAIVQHIGKPSGQ